MVKVWKDYFEEQITVYMCDFHGIQGGSYFGGDSIRGTEVEVRLSKLKEFKG